MLVEGAEMAITIHREQRDAIYDEVMTDLTGSGDVWVLLQSGDYEAAKRIRRRLADDMRLLDDLGWEPQQDRDGFELTMEVPDLARALRTLNENARSTLSEQINKPIDEAVLAQRALVAQTTYGDVLAQIAEAGSAEGGERSRG